MYLEWAAQHASGLWPQPVSPDSSPNPPRPCGHPQTCHAPPASGPSPRMQPLPPLCQPLSSFRPSPEDLPRGSTPDFPHQVRGLRAPRVRASRDVSESQFCVCSCDCLMHVCLPTPDAGGFSRGVASPLVVHGASRASHSTGCVVSTAPADKWENTF